MRVYVSFNTLSINICTLESLDVELIEEFLGAITHRVAEIAIKTLGRRERYVIVLNSGLILSPDFLYFMSQLVTIVDIDRSLVGISAWNVNGSIIVASLFTKTDTF